MNKYCILLMVLASCAHPPEKPAVAVKKNCCEGKKDTIVHLKFKADSSFQDFYKLLDFMERTTEYRRYDTYKRSRTVPITKANKVILEKQLCWESANETCDGNPTRPIIKYMHLEGLHNIRCKLKSIKPLKGTTDYFANFYLTQINCVSIAQKDSVWALIKETNWGPVFDKWSSYSLASGDTRIYIVDTSHDATFQDYDDKYAAYIQKEWIDKHRK